MRRNAPGAAGQGSGKERTLRIIGGEARGRKLFAPAGLDTRPTTDRVREAVFGILQARLYGARVLDLFAGSGAMGLEAVSRGAAFALINDAARTAMDAAAANVALLGYEGRVLLESADALALLKRLAAQGTEGFDVVFLDPPYGRGLETEAIGLIDALGLLRPGGAIVVEHTAGEFSAPGFAGRSRKYGHTGVTVLEKQKAGEGD